MTNRKTPLADMMRPAGLDEFYGQEDLVGSDTFLRQAIDSDSVSSMILWGPPGTGKTTLARIIANKTNAEFVSLSATSSGVKDLKEVIDRAQSGARIGLKTILFIDEIHRWNKSQQDRLLPYVERGTITLIGATTENPSFEINSALLSRTRVFVLKRLSEQALLRVLGRALKTLNRDSDKMKKAGDDELLFIAKQSNGDARTALNILEAVYWRKTKITINAIKEILQKQHLLYDKNGEEHHNLISALHKSMRGGDQNASVYWLVRMLEGGEDPLYIARRLVRFASEDIGIANNSALLLTNAVFDACHKLGMPECGVHLAHAVIYLAKSDKNISAYEAYSRAQKDVKDYGNLPVPLHLRNAPTKLMKNMGYGKGYKYTPKEDSKNQQYFPKELETRKYIDA